MDIKMINQVAAVFLSAREIDKYAKLVFDTGVALSEIGYDIVYGGGYQGLMGMVAKGVESAGGIARGYTTHHLFKRELSSYNREYTHFVKTMGERKEIQLNLADIVVILPGGFGTLDELFETLTFNQIGLSKQRIFVLDPDLELILKQLLRAYVERGTISQKDADIIEFVKGPQDLKLKILNIAQGRINHGL